jgi:hypothetical protein
MLRKGLTAAGLLVAAVILVAGSRAQPAQTSTVAHTCGAQDRQFLRAAALSNTEVALLGQDFVRGELTAAEAIAQTRDAALGLQLTSPRDPTLRLARSLMRGMFVEYGRAIRAQSKGGNPGRHMYRSYSLANYAHQELAGAEVSLTRLGCPVSGLLQE